VRRFLLLLLVAAVVFWILRDQPTVAGLIDKLTSPLLGSRAVVDESEHKRVLSEAAPAIQGDTDDPLQMIREGMPASEVRRLLGKPDSTTDVTDGDRPAVAWDYRKVGRRILIADDKVVSIAVR